MVEKTLTVKIVDRPPRSNNLPYFHDTSDNINTTGITVDEDTYDAGSFLDRDYDVRLFKNFNLQVLNSGANSIDIRVLATTKDFDDLDGDLADADFTETELAEETVASNATSTLYNLDRTVDGKPAITAVRLQAKEVVAANPGEVTARIKAL